MHKQADGISQLLYLSAHRQTTHTPKLHWELYRNLILLFLGAGYPQQQAVIKVILCSAVNPTLWKFQLSAGHPQLPAEKNSHQPRTGCVLITAFPTPHLLSGAETLIGAELLTQPLPCSSALLGLPLLQDSWRRNQNPSQLHSAPASTSYGASSPSPLFSQAAREVLVPQNLLKNSLKPSAEVWGYTLLIPPMIHSLQIKKRLLPFPGSNRNSKAPQRRDERGPQNRQ